MARPGRRQRRACPRQEQPRQARQRLRRGCPRGSSDAAAARRPAVPEARRTGRSAGARAPAPRASRAPGAARRVQTEQGPRRRHGQHARGQPAPDVQLLGARHRERQDRRARSKRDERRADPERREAPRRPSDAALGEEDEHATGIDHGAGRGQVLLDADAAAPDREHAAEAPQQPLLPALVERRRGTAEEPGTRLQRQRVQDEERIDPAAMDCADEQIAAGRARRTCSCPDRSIRKRSRPKKTSRAIGARAGRRATRVTSGVAAEPCKPFPGVAARRPQRLGRDAGRLRPRARGRRPSAPAAAARLAGPAGGRARSAGGRRGDRVVDGRDVEGSSSTSSSSPRSSRLRDRGRRHDHVIRGARSAVTEVEDRQRAHDEPGRDDLGDRNPEEHPVVRAQRLEHEPDAAVPDEEHRDEVARPEPVPVAARQEEDHEAPEQPRERLVQEQRVEVFAQRRGRVRARRTRVLDDPMGAVDRDAPRQVRRRAVELLVEEVPPAGDAPA